MNSHTVLLKGTLIVLVLALLLAAPVQGQAEDAAQTAILDADHRLASAFASVHAAEEAGANVSSLVDRLTLAAGAFDQAQRCYREGNFSGASAFAQVTMNVLDGLEAEAAEQAEAAREEFRERLLWTGGLSAVGVTVVGLVAGLVGWPRLRAYYVGKVLKMRPEVGADAESG